MFKIKAVPTDAATPLPDGCDDEAGAFFVPKPVRDTWAQLAGQVAVGSLLQETIRVIAERRVHRELYPESYKPRSRSDHYVDPATGAGGMVRVEVPGQPRHLQSAAAVMARDRTSILVVETVQGKQLLAEIMRASWNEIAEEAEHAIRLDAVLSAYVSQVERHEQEVTRRQELLCPVCGVSDESTGVPALRDVVPGGLMRDGLSIKLTSCLGCYLAAVDHLTQLHAVAPLTVLGGKTRAQLVAQHLKQAGVA